jgi:hypothetical protein
VLTRSGHSCLPLRHWWQGARSLWPAWRGPACLWACCAGSCRAVLPAHEGCSPPLKQLYQLQAPHPCTLSARTCSAGTLFTYPEPVPSVVFPFTVTQHKVAQAICAQLYHHINCCCRHLQDWQAAGPEGVKAYQSLKMLTFDFILQVGRVLLRHCGTF